MGCSLSAAGDGGQASASIVSGTHQFTIRGYNGTKGIGVGKSILSQYFTVDGRTWFVRYYPDGYNSQSSGFVAFYVQTLYKPLFRRPVRARFIVELIRPDGSVAYARRSDPPCNFDTRCNSWGLRAFVARNHLESADLGVLHQNAIKVRCTVEVVNSRRKRRGAPAPVPAAAAADYAANAIRFFSSGTAPFDVQFSVDGVIFEAHALVVAAQSEWFAAALYGHGRGERWMEAGLPCITISGTTPEAFQGVLHYVYHDTLPEELVKAKGEAVLMPELFKAADMFLIGRMKAMCARRLAWFINDDTVRSIMELAQAHSCEELQQVCQNFMGRRRP